MFSVVITEKGAQKIEGSLVQVTASALNHLTASTRAFRIGCGA